MTSTNATAINALTIDVEDWIQSVYDVEAPLTDCFVRNTHAVLDLLAANQVKATFFVLGLAAEKAPGLIKEIHAVGHEVQSHGYGHRLIHTQTRAQFREDIARSKGLLEDLLGEGVTGYRAPAFSITARTLWALDVLVETGFAYDSSIFPVRMRRYGIDGVPRCIHRRITPTGYELIEVPVSSLNMGPVRIPTGGGGYLRVLPYWITRAGVAQANRAGQSAVLYVHPYEFAPGELRECKQAIPWLLKAVQSWGRISVSGKIASFLTEFRFEKLGNHLSVLANKNQLPLYDLDSAGSHSARNETRVAIA